MKTVPVPNVEKAERVKLEIEFSTVVALALLTCFLVILGVILYVIGQSQAGGAVIVLAGIVLGFAGGRVTGETAGLKKRQRK